MIISGKGCLTGCGLLGYSLVPFLLTRQSNIYILLLCVGGRTTQCGAAVLCGDSCPVWRQLSCVEKAVLYECQLSYMVPELSCVGASCLIWSQCCPVWEEVVLYGESCPIWEPAVLYGASYCVCVWETVVCFLIACGRN